MGAALDDHIAYLAAKLAGFRARPELHRHQIAAAEMTLARARDQRAAGSYLGATGDLFELTRAEWLDRHFNRATMHEGLGNGRKCAAAIACYRAGMAATGHHDFGARVSEGMIAGRALELPAETAETSLTPLLVELLEWRTAVGGPSKQTHHEAVLGFWAALTAAHPGCEWQTLCDVPRYRNRLPFDDDGLSLIGGWLALALRDVDSPSGPPAALPAFDYRMLCQLARDYAPAADGDHGGDGTVPSAMDAVRGYEHLRGALAGDDPVSAAQRAVCDAILEAAAGARDAAALMRHLVETGLDVDLVRAPRIAMARALLARAAGWSQLHIESHARSLCDALEHARSTTEVEHEVALHEECFAVESAWNELVLTYATRPLRAALSWEHDNSEARRQSIITSYRVATELFGLDWNGLIETPRVWRFVSEVLATHGQLIVNEDTATRGAAAGEIGLAVTREVQKAAALVMVARVERGEIRDAADLALDRPRFASARALAAHATALFHDATGGGAAYVDPGPRSRRTLRLWNRPVPIARLVEVLARPPRPELVFPPT